MSTDETRREIRSQVKALNDLQKRCVCGQPGRAPECPTPAPSPHPPTRSHPSPHPHPARSMVNECYLKCVPNPRDGDLSIGEMACLDRCVPKYLEAHELVGREIETVRNAFGGAGAAAAAATTTAGAAAGAPAAGKK